ncbi:mRNA interferase [Paraburkholderia aromaticivorans]|uniref:mRNA interferase n=1 Tax=Paraburkholderia aromaticivorans TaxID=2026199 RepID=A0A248VNS0_9BURK|nr:type II toxin-antitoxin system HicA family toxin [Paraburkholderia aromaticivorans]ASW00515.1 mRNA interferase [Paraburkholderia aromaticivorans]
MKQEEFKRWLEEQGVVVENGKKHWKAYYNGKQTTVPRHPGKELKDGTRRAILKQLGLK